MIMEVEFEMIDLGRLSYFLCMEFTLTYSRLVMHQKKYIKEVLKRFNMATCNPISTPTATNEKLDKDEEGEEVDDTRFKKIVGCLRFLCNSRPDICHGVGLVSRFMSNPRKSHMLAAKRLLKYIQGTTD
ncbi:putative RNA-directed DNA polymerase [Lupinus albus]|uniref:Putative RNA-directed DNA polymerase n=1 Tax=Lupinus albus TaxID=3870 RepID=A0A6A4NGN6_LUPAL|nr:putative RNA-directed DNA polymerase [Lupinus albus]